MLHPCQSKRTARALVGAALAAGVINTELCIEKALELLAAVRAAQVTDAKLRDEALRGQGDFSELGTQRASQSGSVSRTARNDGYGQLSRWDLRVVPAEVIEQLIHQHYDEFRNAMTPD